MTTPISDEQASRIMRNAIRYARFQQCFSRGMDRAYKTVIIISYFGLVVIAIQLISWVAGMSR